MGLKNHQQAIGISVLNGKPFLEKDILAMNGGNSNFSVKHQFSHGGYAKSNPELNLFCKSFSLKNAIPVEPVYTGKLFYGLYDLIRNDYFKKGSAIVAVHTGGVWQWDQYND